MEDFWSEDSVLVDLLFNTNQSHKEIAKELQWSEYKVSQRIRELGLDWVKRKTHKLSRGQAALHSMVQKLVPNEEVVSEHVIGNRLRLDIYCPRLKLAAEYHGRQHFYYVEHFHGNRQGFLESQKRDEQKVRLCEEQGITLVAFRYNDDLSEDIVFGRLLSALQHATPSERVNEERASRYKGNPYYESQKQRAREYRRKQYREMKAQQKKRR